MGNTSDRVSGDRHGAKAHRSDSAGSHKEQEHSKIMVDSTDDPNIFNTHTMESKVLTPPPPPPVEVVANITMHTFFHMHFILLLYICFSYFFISFINKNVINNQKIKPVMLFIVASKYSDPSHKVKTCFANMFKIKIQSFISIQTLNSELCRSPFDSFGSSWVSL